MHKLAYESGQVAYDEITGLPLDPKLVADAIKEELMFMRKLRVHHEVPTNYLDESGLKTIGTRWVYTNKGDAANPSKTGGAGDQQSERVDTRRREQHVCATPPLESLKIMLSRCMTGKRRTPAEEKVQDISRAHVHSPARRTIVIKVPKEDDECVSGYAVLDQAMYGTKDTAQRCDVASENAMTASKLDHQQDDCSIEITG